MVSASVPSQSKMYAAKSPSGSLMFIPVNETCDAVLDGHARIVVEQSPRLRNVRERDRHVARLKRLPVDLRRLAGGFLDETDQFAQFDRARFAEIDDLVV